MGFGRSTTRGTGFKRKRIIIKVLFGVAIIAIFTLAPTVYNHIMGNRLNDNRQLRQYFEMGAFESAHSKSAVLLLERPLDPHLLTIHGFSAYQLAIAQINSVDTLSYMAESVWSLRKALLSREDFREAGYITFLARHTITKGRHLRIWR